MRVVEDQPPSAAWMDTPGREDLAGPVVGLREQTAVAVGAVWARADSAAGVSAAAAVVDLVAADFAASTIAACSENT